MAYKCTHGHNEMRKPPLVFNLVAISSWLMQIFHHNGQTSGKWNHISFQLVIDIFTIDQNKLCYLAWQTKWVMGRQKDS